MERLVTINIYLLRIQEASTSTMELARLKAFKPTTPAGTAAATAAGVVGASLLARQVYRSYCGASKASDKWSHMPKRSCPPSSSSSALRTPVRRRRSRQRARDGRGRCGRGIILTNRHGVGGAVRRRLPSITRRGAHQTFHLFILLAPCDLSLSLLSHPPVHPLLTSTAPPPQLATQPPSPQKVV